MRRAPINYLASLAIIGALWVAAAILAGNHLGDNAALSLVTPEDFTYVYKIIMSVAAAAGAVGLSHWYWHGSQDAAAANVAGARRFWNIWLFILAIASVGVVAAIVVAFRGERFTAVEYLTVFGSASALTWVPYWLCSLLMSPRGVKNAPVGMG